ncbi:MAG: molybdate ABC transporter substrate-binding protein [Dehalococcoidales bacterium]
MKNRFNKIKWLTGLCAALLALSLVAASCGNAATTSTTTTTATTTTTTLSTTTTTTTTPATTTTTGTTTSATTTTTAAATTTAAPTTLTVNDGKTTNVYTLAQLEALDSVSGYEANRNGTGTVSATNSFTGVRLTTLIKDAGGMVAGSAVKITGSGNYSKILSYSQVYSGTFNVYDQTGAATVASNQPYMAIIYQLNGSPLDAATGPFESGVITASNQEGDASLWIKNAYEIDILPPVTLNISAASSLANVLKAIDTAYTQANPNVTIVLNTAASGTLQTQIENGAPADVFLSAATANMDALQKENLIVNTSRKNLLDNTLVMIVPNGSTLGLTSISDLATSKVSKIAVGDPASVPAGTYANLAFTELGITAAVQSKLILCANVTQVLTTVASGNVDAGLVYSTDALSSNQVKVVAQAPADINAQIVYPEAVLSASKNPTAAQAYLSYLSGSSAVALFIQYGFTMAGN